MAEPRIALLTLDFPPGVGGVQQYLYETGRRLGRRCDLTVMTPGGGSGCCEDQPFACLDLPASPWQVGRALHRLEPDLILVGHAHPRLLLPARLSRRRYMALAYGNDFEAAQKRWHRPLFNRLLAGARPLVTISRANARRLRALGLPPPAIVRPGTDPHRFRPPDHPRQTPTTLLTVGRLVSRKGIDRVLRALPRLLPQNSHLRYWIVGDGPERPRLEQLAREMGVADAVRFWGGVDDDELPAIYQGADIFVMPARTEVERGSVEGFGIVYLEASASGLPVVAGRSGGVADAVREGETGLLVPPDDLDALTAALSRLLSDGALCRRLGRQGRAWVEAEMHWERAAAELFALIQAADHG